MTSNDYYDIIRMTMTKSNANQWIFYELTIHISCNTYNKFTLCEKNYHKSKSLIRNPVFYATKILYIMKRKFKNMHMVLEWNEFGVCYCETEGKLTTYYEIYCNIMWDTNIMINTEIKIIHKKHKMIIYNEWLFVYTLHIS